MPKWYGDCSLGWWQIRRYCQDYSLDALGCAAFVSEMALASNDAVIPEALYFLERDNLMLDIMVHILAGTSSYQEQNEKFCLSIVGSRLQTNDWNSCWIMFRVIFG